MTNKDSYLSLNYSGKSNPVKYNDQRLYSSRSKNISTLIT